MSVTVRVEIRPTLAMLNQMQTGTTPALVRALNRAATSARVVAAQAVAKDMGLKPSFARDRIVIGTARPDHLVATVSGTTSRIPISAFDARQTRRGVTYRGQNGRQLLPHAFMARVTGPLPNGVVSPGHNGVFQRRGKPRLPIDELYGPSVWKVFVKYAAIARARGEEQLIKNLQSELRYALRNRATT
jgi:hypothetical protein